MYIAAGGPGLKLSGLVVIWFGEASFSKELGPVVGVVRGRCVFGSEVVR